MFNDEQKAHMAHLARTDVALLCWCGWYRLGECLVCNQRHFAKTRADYLAAACPDCYTLPPHHVHGCPNEGKK